MTTQDAHGLVGAYALDALSDVERRRFEHHLAECDTCLHELRGLRETTAALAVAAAHDAEARNDRIAAVLAASDAHLTRGRVTGGGSGTVVAARSRNEVVVIMADTAPVLAAGIGDATQVGVTVEPAGGSPGPTGAPVFTADLGA